MGLIDIIGAIGKVMAERQDRNAVRDYAAIDPDTGMKAFENDPRPLPPGRTSFLTDVVRSSRDEVTSDAANRIGFPETGGLNPTELSAFLQSKQLPIKQRSLDLRAQADADRNANAKARIGVLRSVGARRDGQSDVDRLKQLEGLTTGKDGLELQVLDPEYHALLLQERDDLRKRQGKPTVARPAATPAGAAVVNPAAQEGKVPPPPPGMVNILAPNGRLYHFRKNDKSAIDKAIKMGGKQL